MIDPRKVKDDTGVSWGSRGLGPAPAMLWIPNWWLRGFAHERCMGAKQSPWGNKRVRVHNSAAYHHHREFWTPLNHLKPIGTLWPLPPVAYKVQVQQADPSIKLVSRPPSIPKACWWESWCRTNAGIVLIESLIENYPLINHEEHAPISLIRNMHK